MEEKESALKTACLSFFFVLPKSAMNTQNIADKKIAVHNHQSRDLITTAFHVYMHIHLDINMTREMK
jgi:hypothetical protein